MKTTQIYTIEDTSRAQLQVAEEGMQRFPQRRFWTVDALGFIQPEHE